MELLRVEKLSASYGNDGNRFQVLKEVDFSVNEGDFIAIEGPSGSGKSTLFYILGCLLRPEKGKVFFEGQDLTKVSTDDLSYIRNHKIGFIFQQFHLLPRATVLDNILLPTVYPCETSHTTAADRAKAEQLAKTLGIDSKLHRSPNQLSGGQQQRVAIARALMRDVKLLLADEPTGNLDSQSALQIMELLRELNRQGKTIILITHDHEVAKQCGKIWRLKDGSFTEVPRENQAGDTKKAEVKPEAASLPLAPPAPNVGAGFKRGIFPYIANYFRLTKVIIPLALENLRRNKTQAFLSMIGVTVGIAAVLAMTTFGQFVKDKILQSYQDLGVNTISIWGGRNWRLRATDKVDVVFDFFDLKKDITPLYHIFPDVEKSSVMLSGGTSSATYGGRSIEDDVWVVGVEPQYLPIANRVIESGRNITPYHVGHADGVCLIGSDVSDRLFNNVNPVGQIVFISRDDRPAYPCQVIAVLKALKTNKDWMKPNHMILMPYTYYASVNPFWEGQIHRFFVQLRDGSDVQDVSYGIKAFFKQKYGESGFFSIGSDAILLAQMKRFLTLFTVMLAIIALITLGVGGMGINNMMLVAISERLKEIGLRKAIGATDRSIRLQFLLESLFLCLISGLSGVILGFSSYELIIYATSMFVTSLNFEWIIEPTSLIISLVSILLVGVGSGIVPALKAERLQVIEALRNE